MLKAIEKMHARSKMVQLGMSCMGQQLVGAYRLIQDEETNKTFCMMMYWNGRNDHISYSVHESDEYMHLFFEDVPNNWERERQLRDHGNIELPSDITESKAYQKVYAQLFRAIRKKMSDLGCIVDDDMTVRWEESTENEELIKEIKAELGIEEE